MSDEQRAMIDLKGLTEPATKLIETVSAGIGCLYLPRHIRNVAKAEAERTIILANAKAEETLIQAKADAKAMDIRERAQERIMMRELKRQENIESVLEMALRQLPSRVEKEPVDPDWTAAFFDHCQDVSNEQMQSVWVSSWPGKSPGRGPTRCGPSLW
jgi:Protein of unknown function (DUF2806)